MKKVLLIDPRGVGSNGNYTKGLLYGLLKSTEVSIATNYHFNDEVNGESYPSYRIFFRYSETMQQNAARKFIRGIEYCIAYKKIIKLIKKEKFDIVHINWLLMYKFDSKFLLKIHSMGLKIVYTAHNVLPHIKGSSNKEQLRRIYEIVDQIIVHGIEVKREFLNEFPEFQSKLYVQKHGCNCMPVTRYEESLIDDEIRCLINKYDERFLFFGNIFYNKGVDVLLNYWANSNIAKDSLLIIAGRKRESYKELEEAEKRAMGKKNILYLDYFIDDNLLNYLISNSSIILLPYRHASMSGVVFTAADFAKPILCTSAGALNEYLTDKEDSFISSDLEQFLLILEKCIKEAGNLDWCKMGKNLQYNIYEKCNWVSIVQKMVDECY